MTIDENAPVELPFCIMAKFLHAEISPCGYTKYLAGSFRETTDRISILRMRLLL